MSNICKCGCGQRCNAIYVRGHNSRGRVFSKTTLKKMSDIKKGKKNNRYGTRHTEATKQKISLKEIGNYSLLQM